MEPSASGALLDAVRGVHWVSRRLTSGVTQGGHRSKRVGSSPEFMDYRPYRQGDDPGKIDWKLFGRTERVAVRLAHDDSSIPTTIVVDASASMAFPLPRHEKWELASAVALGLSAVAYGDGDPVGLLIAGSAQPRALPPRSRRGTVGDILQMLADTRPAGSAPLAPLLATITSSRRIAIVSDLLGDAGPMLAQSRQLIAAGREVFVVHVVAREELAPGVRGMVSDPEQPDLRRALGEADVADYDRAFGEWRQRLGESWRREAAEHVVRRVAAPEPLATPA
jgi:uncharacterized protein (DUF58 family)